LRTLKTVILNGLLLLELRKKFGDVAPIALYLEKELAVERTRFENGI
jgi:hypothetical protein